MTNHPLTDLPTASAYGNQRSRWMPGNDHAARLHERILADGYLEAAELTPEERATASILHARGLIRLEGGRYLQVVMG